MFAVIRLVFDQFCEKGKGSPVGGGAVTVREMVAFPFRPCVSEIDAARFFEPGVVPAPIVAW